MSILLRTAIIVAALTSITARAAEADGAGLYANHCAACHGAVAEGDGPLAAVMTITPPSLRTLKARNDGVFPEDAVAAYIDGRNLVASHGDRQMPIWGDAFQRPTGGDEDVIAARIKAIVWFIETLQYR
jgi:mono/diheme cytochrome c family protein